MNQQNTERICEYCTLEITDNMYTYKYFGLERKMQPVHNYHLIINRHNEARKLYDPYDRKGQNGTTTDNDSTAA